jgi:hypothetical protein
MQMPMPSSGAGSPCSRCTGPTRCTVANSPVVLEDFGKMGNGTRAFFSSLQILFLDGYKTKGIISSAVKAIIADIQ